jgi:hypothetical protein
MRRVLLAALLATGTMLLGAAPADAGGPTSVLLTNPGHGQAAALYYSDPQYAQLEALLHGDGAFVRDAGDLPSGATYLNVTWLAHDVSIWQTDQVYLDGSRKVWVATTLDGSSSAPTTVQLSESGSGRLVALAASLGLMKGGAGQPGTGDGAGAGDPEIAPETASVAPPPTVVREDRWFTLTGWRWAVPGVLLGLLAAVALRGRRTSPGGPRQELIDRAPVSFDGFDRAAGQGRT